MVSEPRPSYEVSKEDDQTGGLGVMNADLPREKTQRKLEEMSPHDSRQEEKTSDARFEQMQIKQTNKGKELEQRHQF